MRLDDVFGPRLPGAFDFTILFEQSILSILPTLIFIILAAWRTLRISRRESVVRTGALLWCKLIAAVILSSLHIELLALWCRASTPRTRTSIPESVFGVAESLAIGTLSYTEHRKSESPSFLLSTYLLLTVILEIALARTFFIREGLGTIATIFTTSVAVKSILLVLEENPKRRLLLKRTDAVRETSAGVVARSLFLWLNPLLWKGTKSILNVDDIGPLHEKLSSKPLLNQLEATWNADSKEGRFKLMRVTLKSYKLQLFAGVLPRLLSSAFNFAQPFLIETVIITVAQPPQENRGKIISGLIGATMLLYIGMAVSSVWYSHMTLQLVTMYRGGLASLVYKKTLRLGSEKTGEAAPVTLMSTDVEGVARAVGSVHVFWSSLLELPVGLYLLYRQVGISSLFVLIPAIISSIGGAFIAADMGPARMKWSQAIQERIGATSSSLTQMKGIKMMGLSGFVQSSIQELRALELKASTKFRWILTRMSILAGAIDDLTPIIIIVSAIFWTKADSGLTAATAFTSIALISIVSGPVMMIIVSGPVMMIIVSFMQLATAIGSFTRLQNFLLQEEQFDRRLVNSAPEKSSLIAPGTGQTEDTRADIELEDLASRPENIDNVQGTVSLQNASIAAGENLLILHDMSLELSRGTLNMVIGRVGCGKSSLLKALIGEMCLVSGSISVDSSSIAYCDQLPWLQNISIRDNIIAQSAHDEEWLKVVLHACALNEDVSHLADGDRSIVGTGGVALSGGQKHRVALARAVFARKSLVILDDVFSGLDSKTASAVFSRVLGPEGLLRKSGATVILVTHEAADFITVLDEGHVLHNQVSYDDLDPDLFRVLDTGSRVHAESRLHNHENTPPFDDGSCKSLRTPEAEKMEDVPTEADLARRTGDIDCYKVYFGALGAKLIAIFLTSLVLHVVLNKMPQIWIRIWTEHDGELKDAGFLGGYSSFALGSCFFAAVATIIICIDGVPKAGQRLHAKLLGTVLRAPLRFFTTVDSGITLNRFSQDITLIDEDLPMAFFATSALALRIVVETGLIVSGATYVAVIIPASMLVLYLVQKYYLQTSRQMRLLDIETKSPLYTQFTETLAGLSTIRVFDWSSQLLQENHRRLDDSQKPFYGMFCIQRWLQIVLDLFVAGMAVILVSFALGMANTTSTGAIGLALVNIIGFNKTLTMLVDQWTELETSLGAIARLKWFYTNTPDENKPEEKEAPPADWPATGEIEFSNVSASYSDELPLVLKDLSLKIKPGQKIGVCGRSGSGKSSLVLTLLRLLEIRNGQITIDGLDISQLSRSTLRSRLMALPQDPLTVPGTVRQNLDPSSTVQSDAILITVLEKVSLWQVLSQRGGLDAILLDLGLSSGQLQLLCLARALLSRGSVVVLDEATSHVDHQTEREIRRVIKEELSQRTVIEVAHRLDIIRACDLVVVMAEGRLDELGEPEELLSRASAFRALWESQGL